MHTHDDDRLLHRRPANPPALELRASKRRPQVYAEARWTRWEAIVGENENNEAAEQKEQTEEPPLSHGRAP
jgi:hypothetical protein